MKSLRTIVLLLSLTVAASFVVSSTMARFSQEYVEKDFALVAKWNFGARGDDDIEGEFYNKGFTFNLFDESVEPMDHGEKSFTFTGGESDVAIEYDVEMNVESLLWLQEGYVAGDLLDIYAPFIFRIQVDTDSDEDIPEVISPLYGDEGYDSGWWRPMDVYGDYDGEDGFFTIFTAPGFFPMKSDDKVTVTVSWQWNTSFFIDDNRITPTDDADDDGFLLYYDDALEEYAVLNTQRINASINADQYLEDHGGGPVDGVWEHYVACNLTATGHQAEFDSLTDEAEREQYLFDHQGVYDDETGELAWLDIAHQRLCPHNHYEEYNYLVSVLNNAIEACETSLLVKYNDYDSLAVDALRESDSKVLFRIKGEQIVPNR